MQIYWNKRKCLHKNRVQLPEDWFGTPTWPPFHCFGTPIWLPWRHVKTLYKVINITYSKPFSMKCLTKRSISVWDNLSICSVRSEINLVPRASFPLTSGRKTRALGATISGMRYRCRLRSEPDNQNSVPLLLQNGFSQSSRFPTTGQGKRSSGNEIGLK